ncbi:nitrite reductase small subunit NirD [Alteromonas sp. 1_MG-2023]|uniref:nitrite reductase small subunit NirD n=1 Tax=Alteromonas sp. 1_MG-2023 TaxID=3062669 RepID=UPI0026E3DA0E|nr:nitrite reductase small subunit NirD [Alteromonas sp. 1_MG-2023]MDO6565729.1 nitrite reductase small subunit NirD [Alteromonas sp. 1_MG-2023]
MTAKTEVAAQWHDVCGIDDVVTNSGVCALINDQQIALFSVLQAKQQYLYAISNWDPVGKANVLYRGLIGSIGDDVVVASPLYKEHYVLATGKCVERDDVSVISFPVKIDGGRILISL